MLCSSCGSANEAGRKFCGECGSKLAATCPTCGSANAQAARFCGECGGSLSGVEPEGRAPAAMVAAAAAQTERRVVSVLFGDLVGFTARSDGNDPEQVREFLAHYFEVSREVVERYGGVIEKFIGDAVMAVWGTPVAREDDPERAVRAALDLVDAVRRLGKETGDEALALRAGVLTGEVAVAVGAVGQGMVAGDLVNTASRLQSVAPPGTVLVGEGTYRVASSAIAFEPAGEQLLKGKSAPVPAWRALRVVAERGGLGRSEGIEAPFVGRDDELRLLKDVLHSTSRERRVRLVSVTGQAGVGKSRLAWEFLKYIDGVLEDIYWHQGRSPSFGDGVTSWALGEMVRRRAKLAEADDEPTTRQRIADALAEYVPDDAERRRIEPILLSLLGVGDAPAGGRDELFAGLRTFFERIAIRGTTVLVFEDLHWSDPGVLDFIDHLLEWSIGYPILVVTLARPELLDRRPGWGAGRRDFVGLTIGPLEEAAMRELLLGLAPELPEKTIRAVLARADGIPLYAVEMIRMLVADGRLEEADGRYRVVGQLGDLRVPDTLQSLIASRLDALDPADRALLQDAALLGQTFSVPALAALTREPEAALDGRLRALVRREILQLDTDPRSPERGQFGFTQALVREVAYATLSKRDRRAKHLAAARYFEQLGDDEVAGVLATHYVDAWAAAPDGPEGAAVAAQARIALRAAAERATSLGSHRQALGFLQRASDVLADEGEQAEVLEQIGIAEREVGLYEESISSLRRAIEEHRSRGDRPAAARAITQLGTTLNRFYRADESEPLLKAAVLEFEDLGADPEVVALRGAYVQALFFLERHDECLSWADRCLADAERLGLLPVVADVLVTKGSVLAELGRWREGTSLLTAAWRLADEHGLPAVAGRAANNLGGFLLPIDPRAAQTAVRDGIDLARRYGMQSILLSLIEQSAEIAYVLGDLEWVERELDGIRSDDLADPVDKLSLATGRLIISSVRGRKLDDDIAGVVELVAGQTDLSVLALTNFVLAVASAANDRFDEAVHLALDGASKSPFIAPLACAVAGGAAIRAGDVGAAEEVLRRWDALGALGASSSAQLLAHRAGVAALEGRWSEAVQGFRDAWRPMDQLGLSFAIARSQLECLSVAPSDDQFAQTAAADAREKLTSIGAGAYLRQLDSLLAQRATKTEASESVRDGVEAPAG